MTYCCCFFGKEVLTCPVKRYNEIQKSCRIIGHFYADTHRDDLRKKFEDAAIAKLPLFVSEFGICDACGNGAGNEEQAACWIDLLEKYQTSYLLWNISNRDESSASFVPDCIKTTDFEEADLNDSAKWFVKLLSEKNK